MPSYTFVIKKDDVVVEFTTNSKEFINNEFEKWVNSISCSEEKSVKNTQKQPVVEEKEKVGKSSNQEQPQKILPNEVEEEISALIEEKIESSSKEGIKQDIINDGDLLVKETPSAFQKLSRKVSEENFDEITQESINEIVEEAIEEEKNSIKEVSFEKIEPQLEDDIEIDMQMPSIDGDIDVIELEDVDFSESEFDAIFQEKINSDVDEYTVKENKKFAVYKQGKNLENPLDSLVLVAGYLLNVETQDRFIMKDIMDISAENGIQNIDYALITKAVSQGFVKVVPDLTGVADVVEYSLTQKGEDYFND